MRRLLTASLMAGLIIAPAVAQHAGSSGHAGGGFSAPHGFSAPRMSGGFNSGSHFSSAPMMPQRNFSAPPQYHWSMPARYGSNQPSSSRNRYNSPPPDWHHSHPSYPASHYRQPYLPYFYARSTYLVPGLLNSYWDYPDNGYAGDQSAYADQGQGQLESNADYQPEPAPYEPQQAQDVPPPPPAGPGEPVPQAAVTLVFKDGHSQQIRNYAMTKTTLYILDDAASGRRPEISLDQIDVSATERMNQAAGVDFVVPAGTN